MKKTTILAALVSMLAGTAMAQTLSWDYPGGEWNYVGGQHGQTAFADLNNDGFLDMFSSQNNNTIILEQSADGNVWWTKIMKAGEGLDQTADIINYRNGSWGFIDYNNDGNLDFIYTGAHSSDYNNKANTALFVYKNNGDKSFTKDDANTAVMAEAAVFNNTDENMSRNHFAIADFNNDGWTDVVINGTTATDGRYLGLFINNKGTFEKSSALTREVNGGAIWTTDLDNDGNMDFIVTGYSVDTHATWVYYGNGDGTFVEETLTYGAEKGTVITIDVDNDGFQDILVAGDGYIKSMDTWISGVAYYHNNGNRTYGEVLNPAGLDGWYRYGGKMQPADMNNDGFVDFVFHTSWGDNNTDPKNAMSKIVFNNGDGTFTPELGGKFYTNCQGGFDAFDYGNDGIMDIYTYGWDAHNNSGGAWANHVMKNITELTAYTAPATPLYATYEQVDGDVLLTWEAPAAALRYNVYAKHIETGAISMVAPANIATGALKFINHGAFLNGTSYTFKGMNAAEYEFGVQSINNGYVGSAFVPCNSTDASFVPTWTYPDTQLWYEWTQGGSGQFGDFNNDDNLDLLLANQDRTVLYEYNNAIYKNKIFEGLNDLRYGGIQRLDYNHDGYLDFVMVACTDKDNAKGTSTVSLYKNLNGTGFEKDEANSAVLAAAKVYVPVGGSVQPGRIACGDFNNDGWIDVVFSGEPADGYDHWRLTKLFWNNKGTFEADTTPIEQVNNNGAYVADLDNDGYMDFIAGGYSDSVGKQVVNVFFSNGDKTFTMVTLEHGCQDGNLMVMDADNDGNQDIFVSGYGTDNGIFMHKNNGDRTFTFKSNSEIGLSDSGDGAWGWASCRAYMVAGDLNNDGYNDIVTHCQWDGSNKYTNIALNNGDGTFTTNYSHAGVAVREGGVSIFDYNHDGRLDVHVYGWGDDASQHPKGEGWNWFNIIMQNDTYVRPYKAPVMSEAYYEQAGDDVKLTWTPAFDAISGEDGIRYNVYAKNLLNGEIMTIAPANIATGYLKFTNHGSFLNGTSYTFKGISAENYEFGVQAINNGNVASSFVACERNPLTGVEDIEAVATARVYAFDGN
ncbi:MAG: VCBS repeat-containing protein, partial [Bacteroidales bacterium]|nr:VCBS repeat-containing protein [Bacteroidales bacterium]